MRDVTPEGSAAPVFLDETPREPVEYDPSLDLDVLAELAAEQAASRASALAKLAAIGGLTEDEVNALIGG